MDTNALARQHLDRRFSKIRACDLTRPGRGWIRAVRDALGMTTRQLSARMGKVQSAIVDMEKSEAADSITLGSLRKAAEALNCELIYALVPFRPLDEILRARAAQVADRQISPVSHSMALENQALDCDALSAERERLIGDLLQGNPTRLWDRP